MLIIPYSKNHAREKTFADQYKWAFCGENFHGMLNQSYSGWGMPTFRRENFRGWLSNRKTHESFPLYNINTTYHWTSCWLLGHKAQLARISHPHPDLLLKVGNRYWGFCSVPHWNGVGWYPRSWGIACDSGSSSSCRSIYSTEVGVTGGGQCWWCSDSQVSHCDRHCWYWRY